MAIVPVVATYGSLMDMEDIGNSRESMLILLKSQKELFHSQINEFHRIVNLQRKLTGTNPLAQEMAASSLGHKTGKKVKDSINPKALKYLQSVFSIKDTTGKKETREISALCRITVTQVRDFFNAERSKVKKLVQNSERIASDISKAVTVGCSTPNQTQFSAKNELVTNITPNSTIVENGTSCSSNQGIVTSASSQSPSTPDNANLLPTESVGSSSTFTQSCTWDFEKSGNVILPWDSEIHRNSRYSQTEHLQISGNLEEGFQENAGNFNDLYTPLSWCPGNANNFITKTMKVSTSFPNVSTDITNINSNTSNLSRNISNISTAAVSTTLTNGVNVFGNNVNASSVQDGQFSINTDTMHVEEGSTRGVDSSDKEFIERIFSMMRKEQTFSGRVKLMEWVLQIQNKAVLTWFSTKGGIAILASWLSDAAVEEQTTVLSVIFKVFCHMPLEKAQPLQMSGILQTVNKLRFYRNPDISKRAKVLLSSWSKMVVRAQALKIARNRLKNGPLTKRKNGALYDKLNLDIPEEIYAFAQDAEDHRGTEPEPGNGLKLLTNSNDTSSKKQELFISAKKTKERRKVQLVEHSDNKLGRNTTIAKASSSNQSRPLSADDIKKAKMRAMYMQEKHGKANSPTENGQLNDGNISPVVGKPSPINKTPSTSNAPQPSRLRINEITNPKERLMEKLLRVQIQWCSPPEFALNSSWQVCSGENSKEVSNQNKRTQREQEAVYQTTQEIPPNPKEPWDSEIDYDDSLTPVIPIDPPSEANSPSEVAIDEEQADVPTNSSTEAAAPDFSKADPELLQVLLKNPQLVEVLTKQGQNLSQEQLVALLELVKKSDSSPPLSISRPASVPKSISIPRPEPEAQHCSLPSPTPPSDATRNIWRGDFPTSQLAQNRGVPVVHTASTTSQYMKLPVSNNQGQYMVPKAVLTNNHISQNLEYVMHHQQPLPPVNVTYQPTNILTSSNYYQANDPTRVVQKQYAQYPEQPAQPAVSDYSRREIIHRPNQLVADDRLNHLNYYYANPNNANNVNSLNMYSRTNEYAPRVGQPEMYDQGRGYDQYAQNYGNWIGEKRPRDPHHR